ncbi:MAG: uracil-DNA glycosylase [Alphaproteobacteria bacterium]|nr:uracil-DNA glycosylase [Alphaproteobacteria bacterium]
MPSYSEPASDCPLCPRLVSFRQQNIRALPDYFNAPVPSFCAPGTVHLLIVGLAPGLHGANRTGRPFTGDYAGDLLYETLLRHKLARGHYDRHINDGLELVHCAITNAVRCVPPQNKPLPAEINTCRHFLVAQISALPQLRAILALGKIAHDSVVKALGLKLKDFPFGHGKRHDAGYLTLVSSYHCSRYNTNTGVLTPDMFDSAVATAKRAALTRR